MMTRKAWFFTVDAIMFAIIILSGIEFYTYYKTDIPHTVTHQFLSEDVLGIMSSQKISDLDPALYALFEENITDDDFFVIEQIGQWWADDKIDLVRDFFEQYIEGVVRSEIGISLHLNGDAVYHETSPEQNQVASGKRIVSGVEKERPIHGAVAGARANRVTKNATLVIPLAPQGTGWGSGEVQINKIFELPENITIHDASMTVTFLADRNVNARIFTINGCDLQLQPSDYVFWQGNGDIGKKNVTPCLQSGVNTWNVTLSNQGGEARILPGSTLVIQYSSEEPVLSGLPLTTVSRRMYFDEVKSVRGGGNNAKSGVWSSMSFNIPRGATNISAAAFIRAENVTDYTGQGTFSNWNGNVRKRDYDYQIFLNQQQAIDSRPDASGTVQYFYGPDQLRNNLQNGTNLLMVYFNCYDSDAWGEQNMRISPASYVEINFTLPANRVVPYGHILLSPSVQFSASNSNNGKLAEFSYPAGAAYIDDARVYLVQKTSERVRVWADPINPPGTLVFESFAPQAVPGELWVPKERLEIQNTVNNYVWARDLNSANHLQSESLLVYPFAVSSVVGYGDVFATQEEAEADALQRLRNKLGIYVNAVDITLSSDSLTNVPSLWGPAIIEVRVWQ